MIKTTSSLVACLAGILLQRPKRPRSSHLTIIIAITMITMIIMITKIIIIIMITMITMITMIIIPGKDRQEPARMFRIIGIPGAPMFTLAQLIDNTWPHVYAYILFTKIIQIHFRYRYGYR